MHAIIFDFDGTILDSEPLHARVLDELLRPHGIRVRTEDLLGLPDSTALERVFGAHGIALSRDLKRDILDRKTRAMQELFVRGEAKAFPGAVELVREASRTGPVGLCTAAPPGDARSALTALGVWDCFTTRVTGADVERGKPDPEPYALACALLGLPPYRCVAIEDSEHGVASAVAAGCKVVAVGHTTQADRLTGAHRLASKVGDLKVDELVALAAS